MRKKPVITAQNISIGYRQERKKESPLHRDLSFFLYQGELTCLLGPNGAGKSTLLRTLNRAQPPLQGEILIGEKSLREYSEKELSRLIGVVLTDKTYAGGLTVYELVSLGRHPHTGFFGKLSIHDDRIIQEAMEQTGITSKANEYIGRLSDGERQKAMIAKALAQECPIVLLDEPTAFLDIPSRIEIMSLLRRIAGEQGKTILMSTHDTEQALSLADRLWLLSRKEGLNTGFTEDMILSGRVEHLFDHPGITFDRTNGSFHAGLQKEKGAEITLHADAEPKYWIRNALERNGYHINENKNNPNTINITAISSQEIILEFQNHSVQSTSVEETIDKLNEINACNSLKSLPSFGQH